MSGLTIRITKRELLEAILERRKEAVADHAKAMERYQRDVERWAPRAARALRGMALQAERGAVPKEFGHDGRYLRLPERLEAPTKPQLDTRRHDRNLRFIRRSASSDFRISREAFEEYTR